MAAAIAFGGFTTIKSYTTFKLCSVRNCSAPSFTTIKNYTQLSNYYCGVPREIEVLLPLRITQLSNVTCSGSLGGVVLLLLRITQLSNTRYRQQSAGVLLPLRITQLSNDLHLRARAD